MIKYKYRGIIHRIAHCNNCDWMEEDYNKAIVKAKKHCKDSGHIVDVETGTCGTVKDYE